MPRPRSTRAIQWGGRPSQCASNARAEAEINRATKWGRFGQANVPRTHGRGRDQPRNRMGGRAALVRYDHGWPSDRPSRPGGSDIRQGPNGYINAAPPQRRSTPITGLFAYIWLPQGFASMASPAQDLACTGPRLHRTSLPWLRFHGASPIKGYKHTAGVRPRSRGKGADTARRTPRTAFSFVECATVRGLEIE